MTIEIGALPYPAKALWPNGSRVHWAIRNRAKTSATLAAFMVTRGWLAANYKPETVSAIRFTIHPKTKGPVPDGDNIVAAMKAYQDGISGALGINDRDLAVPIVEIGQRINGGLVMFALVP